MYFFKHIIDISLKKIMIIADSAIFQHPKAIPLLLHVKSSSLFSICTTITKKQSLAIKFMIPSFLQNTYSHTKCGL